MGKVYSHMTMSLDGFIADPDDGIEELFGWYGAGDVSVPTANSDIAFHLDADSADMLSGIVSTSGALVSGRHLFDITDGWGDNHPIGAPVVVVTHRGVDNPERWPNTSFAPDVESGIAAARKIAGDKGVCVASPSIAAQALDLGLLDEIHVSLVPVLLGRGIPYFANLTDAPHRLGDPEIVAGKRATHLKYTVRR